MVALGASIVVVWTQPSRIGTSPGPIAAEKAKAGGSVAVNRAPDKAYMEAGPRFEVNRGQAQGDVRFVSRGDGYSVALTDRDVSFTLSPQRQVGQVDADKATVRMSLVGAAVNVAPRGEKRGSGVTNYLLGNDRSDWITDVASYGRVRYPGVYPGVDLVYHGDERGRLEYDFVVAPEADPSAIAIAFDGPGGVSLETSGDLILRTPVGELRQNKPILYQERAGSRDAVPGGYEIGGDGKVRFRVGAYDTARPLVIDPVISFATYLGGSGDDAGVAIAADGAGNTYITGATTSIDFPKTERALDPTCGADGKCDRDANGAMAKPDVFITKLDSQGALVYSTYLGASGDDRGMSIAVDSDGNAYVTGRTDSPKFPTTENAFDRLCGSDDQPAVGADYCDTRLTDEPNDPPTTVETKPDVFVSKLAANGSTLSYSSFLGGGGDDARAGGVTYYPRNGAPDEPGDEVPASFGQQASGANGPNPGPAGAITVDSAGRAYVVGVTLSPDFPVTTDAYDQTCGTDSECNRTPIILQSKCVASPFGCLPGHRFQPDVFVAQIDTKVSAQDARKSLLYSTYLGGAGGEAAYGVDLGPNGDVYLTGFTYSPPEPPVQAFPTTLGAFQASKPRTSPTADRTENTSQDHLMALRYSVPFLTRIRPGVAGGAGLRYSTFLAGVQPPGQDSDRRDTGYAVAVDSTGAAFVTGETDSTSFPVQPAPATAAGSSSYPQAKSESGRTRSTSDAFVARLSPDGSNLTYSTHLGGVEDDAGRGIALDDQSRAYVTGYTTSADVPEAAKKFPSPPPRTAFPTQHALQAAPLHDTRTANCRSFVDDSNASPTNDPACRDAFVTVLAPDGRGLEFSTYLAGTGNDPGGSNEDSSLAIALGDDPTSDIASIHLGGRTGTNDFPTVNAVQRSHGGYTDAFVVKVDPFTPIPFVAKVDPIAGPSSGGTEVTITGSGFTSATAVRFGTSPALQFSVSADGSQVVATSPPGAQTADVTVTAPGGTSPVSRFGRFTYVEGAWAPGVNGPTKRYGHTATVLSGARCGIHCGKVLMVGGSGSAASSAELYDPVSKQFQAISAPINPRPFGHTATLLSDGTVLVAGPGKSVETFDPSIGQTGKWDDASVGDLNLDRQFNTATLLTGAGCADKCNKVLLVGGRTAVSTPPPAAASTPQPAELYDPVTKAWTLIPGPTDNRLWLHTATLISGPNCAANCGKVLVVGGASLTTTDPASTGSAELYDPATGAWTGRRTDLISRHSHTATMLSSGKVLIVGGITGLGQGSGTSTGQPITAVEVYDPTKPFDQAFSLRTGLLEPRGGHTAVALPSGRALVVAGSTTPTGPSNPSTRPSLATAEVFDPASGGSAGEWRPAGSLSLPRGYGVVPGGHTATIIAGPNCNPNCGKVLVFGGTNRDDLNIPTTFPPSPQEPNPPNPQNPRGPLAAAQLYTPAPAIEAIDPITGRAEGGTAVRITGSGFTPGSIVRFGDAPASSPSFVSAAELQVVSPPATDSASVDVSVIEATVGRAIAPSKFTYTGLPGAISDLVAAARSSTEVELRFSAPGAVGGAGPPSTDYVIKQSRAAIVDPASFEAAMPLCEAGVCKFTPLRRGERLSLNVDGLTPETTYYFAIRAKENGGSLLGPISNVERVTTGTVIPGGVLDLVATAVNDREVRLTFSAPGTNGADGPPATRYVVKQSTAPIADIQRFEQAMALCEGGVCSLQPGTVGENLSLSVGGLQRDTTYYYALRALDDAGNLGPISNLASAAPGCVAPTAGVGRVVYGGGYRLVSLPEGTQVPAQSVLYSWFNLGRGGRYSTQGADQPVAAGQGYWAWFSCPRSVAVGAGTGSASSPLTAFRASMVGNPSGTSPAVISGHDFTARWDPGANSGSGGYQVSGYRQNQTLAVGEGIWAFSYQDTTLAVRAQ